MCVQVLKAQKLAVEKMAGTYQKWHGMMRESDGTERLPIMRHPPVRSSHPVSYGSSVITEHGAAAMHGPRHGCI